MTTSSSAPSTEIDRTPNRLIGPPVVWFVVAAVLVAVAGFAWATPATAAAPEMRPYTVDYAFDYTTELPPNPVYEGSTLRFGDTVFLSVVDQVDVDVAYVASPAVQIDEGALTTRVLVTSAAGWTRELTTSGPVAIADRQAVDQVTVDFRAALALADEIDRTTATSGALTVRIVAVAAVDGRVGGDGGVVLADETDAELAFALTPHTASLVDDLGAGEAAATGADADAVIDGLAPGTAGASTETGEASSQTGEASSETGEASSETGEASSRTGQASSGTGDAPVAAVAGPGVEHVVQMVPTDVPRPNRISLGLITLDVSFLRSLVTPLALLALVGAAAAVLLVGRARRDGEVAYIAARYGSKLVPMERMPEARLRNVVDLSSFEALRSMSTELEQLIMVDHRGAEVDYYVADGASTYRYRTTVATRPGPAAERGIDGAPRNDDDPAWVDVGARTVGRTNGATKGSTSTEG